MQNDDITLPILIEIREQHRKTDERVDRLEARFDRLDDRVDRLTDRVETGFGDVRREIGQSEIRTATAIGELAGTMHDVRDMLRNRLDLRSRVEQCELDIAELKRAR